MKTSESAESQNSLPELELTLHGTLAAVFGLVTGLRFILLLATAALALHRNPAE